MMAGVYGEELARIVASERRAALAIARAHVPLVRALEGDVRAGVRPYVTRMQEAALLAGMTAAVMDGAQRGWGLGWAFRDRQVAQARAERFAVVEPPPIPGDYLTRYQGTIDAALKRYATDVRRRIADLSQQAAAEGWTQVQLTARVKPIVDGMRTWQAERIARTETMRLWNAGSFARMEAEDEDLIGYEYTVVLDDRTSHICGPLDGKCVRRGDVKRLPPLHPHCVLPGQLVETPGGVIAGMRAWYDGLAVELTLSNGARLSVTGNHLILTPNGFAAAQHVREGDDVVCAGGLDRIVSADPHVDDGVALIEDVFGSLCVSAGMATVSVPASSEDLHGDGELINGQIDVVGPHSLLGDAHQAAIGEHGSQESLGSADVARATLSSGGGLAEALEALAGASDRIMGGRRECAALLWSAVGHTAHHGLRPRPERDAGGFETCDDRPFRNSVLCPDGDRGISGAVCGEDVIDGQDRSLGPALIDHAPDSLDASRDRLAVEPYLLADLIQRHAGRVELGHVVRVNVFAYSGHVYDLQTPESVYLCSGVVISNCRTSLDPIWSWDDEAGAVAWASGDSITGAPGFGEVGLPQGGATGGGHSPSNNVVGDADITGAPVGRSLPIPEDEERDLLSSLAKAESMIRADVGRETAVLFVDGVGVAARRAAGKVLSLGDIVPQMRGGVLTHNHPSGAAFTAADASLACQGRLAEIRVVSKDCTYSLKAGSISFGPEAMDELFNKADAYMTSVAIEIEQSGADLSRHEWVRAVRHQAWERLHDEGFVVYTWAET